MTAVKRGGPPAARPVDDEEFDSLIADALGEADGQREGLFGMSSMVWRVSREAAVFTGAGRAALMQLAHPWVAQAIADHSTVRTRPIKRFQRTFRAVYGIVYGDLDAAQKQARAMRNLHQRITGVLKEDVGPYEAGSDYSAQDGRACAWVYATLADTSLTVYQRLVGPLSNDEIAQYLSEFSRFALCFGAPRELLPTTADELSGLIETAVTSGEVTVSDVARDVAEDLFEGVRFGPFWYSPPWYRDVTTSLLPEALREGFQFNFTDQQKRRAQKSLDDTAKWVSRLPPSLRFVGPYHEAHARILRHESRFMHRVTSRMLMGGGRW